MTRNEKIDKFENTLNSTVDKIIETAETKTDEYQNTVEKDSILHSGVDVNGNGVLDDDELTEEQLKQKLRSQKCQKDIKRLFYFVWIFTFVMMTAKFITYFLFDTLIDIDISKLANTLNLIIVVIGITEGTRSITKTLEESAGEEIPVPAYKLKILFGYLIAFAVISIIAILFDFFVKATCEEGSIIPQFNTNDFTSGLFSNTIAYLIARYGSKVTESIDLSSIPFLKK